MSPAPRSRADLYKDAQSHPPVAACTSANAASRDEVEGSHSVNTPPYRRTVSFLAWDGRGISCAAWGSGIGQARGMVARRMRRDTFRGLRLVQPEHRICGPAHLEGPRFLKVLAFEEKLARRPAHSDSPMSEQACGGYAGRCAHAPQACLCRSECTSDGPLCFQRRRDCRSCAALDPLTVRDAVTFSATISAVTADKRPAKMTMPGVVENTIARALPNLWHHVRHHRPQSRPTE